MDITVAWGHRPVRYHSSERSRARIAGPRRRESGVLKKPIEPASAFILRMRSSFGKTLKTPDEMLLWTVFAPNRKAKPGVWPDPTAKSVDSSLYGINVGSRSDEGGQRMPVPPTPNRCRSSEAAIEGAIDRLIQLTNRKAAFRVIGIRKVRVDLTAVFPFRCSLAGRRKGPTLPPRATP